MSPHGTEDRYANGGCRCDPCSAAATRGRKVRRLVTRDQADPLTVSAVGSRRRLHALMTVGWSLPRMEREAGVKRWTFIRIHKEGERVHRDTAELISQLYDELWNTEPSTETKAELHGVSYSKAIAKRNGYAPPMAWDDDTIDDPAAEPRLDVAGVQSIDWVLIDRVIAGHASATELSDAEKIAAGYSMARKGVLSSQIASALRTSGARARRWVNETREAA